MSSCLADDLGALARQLRSASRAFDPATVDVDEASVIVDAVSAIERAAGSIRCRAAARAAEGPEWQREGFSSPDEWLAAKTGTTRGGAHKMRRLGERLGRHAKTRKRLEEGQVSEGQAGVVAGAADENPEAEALVAAHGRAHPIANGDGRIEHRRHVATRGLDGLHVHPVSGQELVHLLGRQLGRIGGAHMGHAEHVDPVGRRCRHERLLAGQGSRLGLSLIHI